MIKTDTSIRIILEIKRLVYSSEEVSYAFRESKRNLIFEKRNEREYFYEQLDRLFPHMKEKYIRTYGNQYIIDSPDNTHLMKFFHQKCSENGIVHDNQKIFNYLNTFEEKGHGKQLSLWDWAEE